MENKKRNHLSDSELKLFVAINIIFFISFIITLFVI